MRRNWSRNNAAFFVAIAALAALVGGCSTAPKQLLQRFEFEQPHMGTLFRITVYAPDAATARVATEAAFARVAALENIMTDYDPESELMRLCQKPAGQPVRVSEELFDILQRGQRLARLTDGAFDVSIGPVVRLWRRARRQEKLPEPETLRKALALVNYKKIELDSANRTVTLLQPNMQLDLGGIAKGYAADEALTVLKNHGLPRALAAASGDIAIGNPPPGKRAWRIGIGQMESPGLARTLLLRNAAVSTSGDTEQFVEIDGRRYSHIVNPHTGIGLTERLQVTVIGRHATDTDSYATAVSVLGMKRGLALIEAQPDLAAFILRKEDSQTEAFESRRLKKIQQASPAE